MVSTGRHLVHVASWEKKTGENARGDATYAAPVDIPCRIERRSAFERGQGEQSYTRVMVGRSTLVNIGDKLEGEVVEDYSDQVDVSGAVVGRIVYLEGGG